jgi:hypothetical protein
MKFETYNAQKNQLEKHITLYITWNECRKPLSRVEHGHATRFETDINDNTLKHSIGSMSGFGLIIAKNWHEWLHTGECGCLKLHPHVTETDRTTIKTHIKFFSSLPLSQSQSCILFVLLFLPIFDIEDKYYVIYFTSL